MTTRSLLIDTSSKLGLCAIVEQNNVLFERYVEADSSHSEHLFLGIKTALLETGIEFKDLASVIYCAGPGSFTGLRIAYSAVKGFELATGLKSYGVSTLFALIHNLKNSDSDYKVASIAGSSNTVFALVQDKFGNTVLEEASYTQEYFNEFISGLKGTVSTTTALDKVTALGMLASLEHRAIDGINYLKASYAEERRSING